MKKIFSITILCLVLMFGSSFKTETPAPAPATVPPYSMVDITDLDLWAHYYNNDEPFYAIKVVFTGNLFSDNTQGHQCEDIVPYPHDTDIWNADAQYWVSTVSGVIAYVYVKLHSNSSWTSVGALSTYYQSYSTSQANCLQTVTISYFDLQAPNAPIEE
jgi:hypothetical protein